MDGINSHFNIINTLSCWRKRMIIHMQSPREVILMKALSSIKTAKLPLR